MTRKLGAPTVLQQKGKFSNWLIEQIQRHGGRLPSPYISSEGALYMDCSVSQIRNFMTMVTAGNDPLFAWQTVVLHGAKRGKTRVLVLVDDAAPATTPTLD